MKRLAALLGFAAAALACVACQPPETVPVVGDSVTAWSAAGVTAAMPGAVVTATPGIDLADGRSQLVEPAVATRPRVIVVELGVNSAGNGWTATDEAELAATITAVATVPCVVWVLPDALVPSFYDNLGPGTLHDNIGAMRATMRATFPANVHLADWGPIEAGHPEWYHPDGMHLSPAGQTAYGVYVAQQVATACPTEGAHHG